MVSNVTGHNLPVLRSFLNCLPSSQSDDKYVVDAPFEFQISDVFSVPFVGTVVVSCLASLACSPILRVRNLTNRAASSLRVQYMVSCSECVDRIVLILANDPVLLGPDSVGQFMPTAVKTIQRKRASVNSAEAGQSVS